MPSIKSENIRVFARLALVAAALFSLLSDDTGAQFAYIGPGAGFAFLGSFLALLAGFLLGALSFLLWPARVLWRAIRSGRGLRRAKVRKLVFLGLDGLDPRLTERFMAEGKLPNLARLAERGCFRRLRTTFPALSPVAWSTFATGVNPARHNIFDFLNRSLKSYLPELSSSRVNEPRRVLKLGRYRLPLSRASVEMRRKSRTFWQILGDYNVGATILRVPITFPPEKFPGKLLSAMCTPDLLGTQGSFSWFTTRHEDGKLEGGNRLPLKRDGARLVGALEGPRDYMTEGREPLRLPFTLALDGECGTLEIGGASHRLRSGEYSDWIRVTFRARLGLRVHGVCRFLITETEPEASLYISPINIDPERPALPISHPSYYAAYLAKLLGTFSTLGMAEDTWALNEGAIDEAAFLKQAWLTYGEREAMFLSALERTRRGVLACVFDTSDRVQHMFYRYLKNGNGNGAHARTIEDLYRRMDELVGKTAARLEDSAVLFVLSDHGFASFERGVNLNSWLRDNGYLALENGSTESGDYLRGVDWSRTRAYTFGLGGLYINQKGREAHGIVSAGAEAAALRRELSERLSGLRDPEKDRVAVNKAWPSDSLYRGPYLDAAPDLIVGYNDGYRASWEAAVGKCSARVFEDNPKAWSGDHCIDPTLVPGVLFSNRPVSAEDPGIEDLAPTALSLFGVKPPAYMEGKPLL